ncbi:MAG: transposase, family protein [Herbinix sp.]|jgi:hypothetical protein|nr:transposase, family protein [Herbinix sp.]
MSLVYSKNKKNGITYVYESTGYWDTGKKQARNKRVCIGKLDEDGKLIPSKKIASDVSVDYEDIFAKGLDIGIKKGQLISILLLKKYGIKAEELCQIAYRLGFDESDMKSIIGELGDKDSKQELNILLSKYYVSQNEINDILGN